MYRFPNSENERGTCSILCTLLSCSKHEDVVYDEQRALEKRKSVQIYLQQILFLVSDICNARDVPCRIYYSPRDPFIEL